jgi:hypothetical protein
MSFSVGKLTLKGSHVYSKNATNNGFDAEGIARYLAE